MTSPKLAKTISLKACHRCFGELIESDHFCRWCGVEQGDIEHGEKTIADKSSELADYETVTLREDAPAPTSISQQLVSTMTAHAATRTATLRKHRVVASLLALLIAVPFWLLIIVLSPLDAYLAARAASSSVQMQ